MRELRERHACGARPAEALSITSIDEPNDVPLQRSQLSELGANSCEVCMGDVSCLGAASTRILDQAHQRADLFDGEAEVTASPDEGEPVHVLAAVATLTT